MIPVETVIIATKTVTLLLGGAITYFALKAYTRTEERAFGVLAVGFAIIVVGSILGGISHQLLDVTLEMGVMIDSMLAGVGFAVILYSLFMK